MRIPAANWSAAQHVSNACDPELGKALAIDTLAAARSELVVAKSALQTAQDSGTLVDAETAVRHANQAYADLEDTFRFARMAEAADVVAEASAHVEEFDAVRFAAYSARAAAMSPE